MVELSIYYIPKWTIMSWCEKMIWREDNPKNELEKKKQEACQRVLDNFSDNSVEWNISSLWNTKVQLIVKHMQKLWNNEPYADKLRDKEGLNKWWSWALISFYREIDNQEKDDFKRVLITAINYFNQIDKVNDVVKKNLENEKKYSILDRKLANLSKKFSYLNEQQRNEAYKKIWDKRINVGLLTNMWSSGMSIFWYINSLSPTQKKELKMLLDIALK